MMNKIKRLKQYSIFILILIFFISYSLLSVGKHLRFETSDDLSIYGQAVWHYSRFQPPSSSILEGIYITKGLKKVSGKPFNQLADHFSPTLALITPFYWLYPSAISLLIAQSLLVALGALPVWWFSKKKLGAAGLVLSFAYLFFVGIQSGIDFNFHPEVIAATWIGFALYFLFVRRFILFFIFFFLALGSKEDIAAIFVGLGIYLFLIKKQYKLGFLIFMISLIWFYLSNIFKIYFQTSTIQFLTTNPKAVRLITQLMSDPLTIFDIMFVPFYKVKTIITLFASFAFLPLASALSWFTTPATFLNRFISDWPRYSTHFQYSATIAPLLAFSTILAIENLKKVFPKIGFDQIKFVSVIIILAGTIWANRPSWDPPFVTPPLQKIFKRSFWSLSENQKEAHRLIKTIPANASVATNTFFVPHLLNRDKIYEIPYVIGKPDIYLVSTVNRYPFATDQEFETEIQKIKNDNVYQLVYDQHNLLLLKKMGN